MCFECIPIVRSMYPTQGGEGHLCSHLMGRLYIITFVKCHCPLTCVHQMKIGHKKADLMLFFNSVSEVSSSTLGEGAQPCCCYPGPHQWASCLGWMGAVRADVFRASSCIGALWDLKDWKCYTRHISGASVWEAAAGVCLSQGVLHLEALQLWGAEMESLDRHPLWLVAASTS